MDCLSFGMREETEKAFQLRMKSQMARERNRLGWTQPEMAKTLGVTKASYEKYEGIKEGRKVPTVVLIEFCRVVDLDLEVFLTGARRKRTQKAS